LAQGHEGDAPEGIGRCMRSMTRCISLIPLVATPLLLIFLKIIVIMLLDDLPTPHPPLYPYRAA